MFLNAKYPPEHSRPYISLERNMATKLTSDAKQVYLTEQTYSAMHYQDQNSLETKHEAT